MKTVISEIEKRRSNLLKLFVSSIAFAFGINFIVDYICNWPQRHIWEIIVGCTIFLIIIVIYIVKLMSTRKTFVRYGGVFILDEKKELVDIPNYEISFDMKYGLLDAISENEGLKNVWEKEKSIFADHFNTTSSQMLNELIEYCVLQKISTFTEDYFNGVSHNCFKHYERKDLSTIIISNCFIKQFSEPMENRKAFNSDCDGEEDSEIILSMFKNGARYERFEFNLPKKARITKETDGTIMFDFKHFTMSLSIESGSNTVLPNYFSEYYVGYTYDISNIPSREYEFIVNLAIKRKAHTLFSLFNREEYAWIDGLIIYLKEYLDFDSFLKLINWPNLAASIEVNKNVCKNDSQMNIE